MTEEKWFTFDGVDGTYEEHDTEAEALEHAQFLIDGSLNEEWQEGVEQIAVGKVTHRAQPENKREDPSGEFDYLVDYNLRPVVRKGADRD